MPNIKSSLRATLAIMSVCVAVEAHALALPGVAQGACPGGASDEYRTYDGSCNNLLPGQTEFGAAEAQLIRLGVAAYVDGTSMPDDLPSTRQVSNAVVPQVRSVLNVRGASAMLMQWGQFLDHDLGLTRAGDSEPVPIAVADDDPVFSSDIAFQRSVFDPATGSDPANPRQQTNANTAFIDASQIYGSSPEVADSLRARNPDGSLGWQLKMTSTVNGDLLHVGPDGMFESGDERANEQVGLTVMHTLFNREHNRLGAEIAAAHPEYDDETVYQETRKLVGAMIQAITYQEFLPALLGDAAIATYRGYDPLVNPGIANEFSTAAYRFGHSTLSNTLLRLEEDGSTIDAGNLALAEAFFNPALLLDQSNGGIEPLLRGLVVQRAQEVDPFMVDALRNMLFGPPVNPVGFDLAALNMQRGRDHGLPGYNAMREVLGLDPYQGWDDALFIDGVKELLMLAYDEVDDIDLWIGGLAERHLDDSMLGELFSTIIADQFERVRDGDRFWYENGLFGAESLAFIRASTLSELIRRNTGIDVMQANVFFVSEPYTVWLLALGIAAMARRRVRSAAA